MINTLRFCAWVSLVSVYIFNRIFGGLVEIFKIWVSLRFGFSGFKFPSKFGLRDSDSGFELCILVVQVFRVGGFIWVQFQVLGFGFLAFSYGFRFQGSGSIFKVWTLVFVVYIPDFLVRLFKVCKVCV